MTVKRFNSLQKINLNDKPIGVTLLFGFHTSTNHKLNTWWVLDAFFDIIRSLWTVAYKLPVAALEAAYVCAGALFPDPLPLVPAAGSGSGVPAIPGRPETRRPDPGQAHAGEIQNVLHWRLQIAPDLPPCRHSFQSSPTKETSSSGYEEVLAW